MQTRFTARRLRAQFYAWHGGQNSTLYAAASSGLVANPELLRNELSDCAASLWTDPHNFKGPKMRAAPYAEWHYLRSVIAALPRLLSAPTKASDGRLYHRLPWAAPCAP